MNYVILFVVVFMIIFVLYYITVISNKKKLTKFSSSGQAQVLIKKYKLDINKNNVKELALKVALTNSFIVASALTVTELVNNFFIKLLVAFLIMVPLIVITYHLIGISMKKEGK